MPPLVCPRCRRANPAEAVFCYFDGAELRAAADRPGGTDLPHEFVFRSGRRCRSFDELARGCQEEWAEARALLHKGVFAQFFAGGGRLDLVQAAQKAQAHADPDVGLHYFIGSLPAAKAEGPRLDLRPRRVILGTLRTGDVRQFRLTVFNQGKGLLHGTLRVAPGNGWLRLVEANGDGQLDLKTTKEQHVTLQIATQGLSAPQTYTTRLTVITNGGIVEVPVSLDLEAYPFPRAPFESAGSPREMAELMRKQPKAAVPLLEGGEVERWFRANGWNYPVRGATAPGVAAVQQFFEGMGLSRPPPLQLSQTEVEVVCVQPERVSGSVTLSTPAKKWVYAHCDSDVPWLRVTTPTVSGPQSAAVGYEIDSSLMDAGRVQVGTVHLTANAGQTLAVRVRVDVRRPHQPFTRRLLRPFLKAVLVVFAYRLLLAGPADLYARVLTAPGSGAGTLSFWRDSPLADAGAAKHFVRQFVLATWWLGGVGGAALLWKRGGRATDAAFGGLAGAGAGLFGGATLACLAAVIDGLPRIVWRGLAAVAGGVAADAAWLWTPAWVLVAAGCWGLLGGAAGFTLRLLGRSGVRLLARAASPLAWLCGLFGAKRAAEFFSLS